MTNRLINYTSCKLFDLELTNYADKFRPDKKTIMFIEPYGAAVSLLKHGIELGYNIVILTANTDMRVIADDILSSVSLAIQVDTSNDERLVELGQRLYRQYDIDAVIPGFEYFVPAASKIASMLGLPGIDCKHVLNLRRKDSMRFLMENAGLAVPAYRLVYSLDNIQEAAASIGFPLICKPVDAAGSVHVRLVDNMEELVEAVSRILSGNDILWGYQLSKSVLLEEYIDGKEYSIEGVIQYGNVTYFGCTEKFVHDQRDFIEIGHIANAPVEVTLKRKIQDYIADVIKVLNADNCPFHAEIRLRKDGQPVLMEIAARLAGDRIAELINLARGINYFDYIYAAYLGEPLPAHPMSSCFAGIRFFYRPDVDCYSHVKGVDVLMHYQPEDVAIYYKPDCLIPAFPKPLRRLGHVIVKNTDYNKLATILSDADNAMQFY